MSKWIPVSEKLPEKSGISMADTYKKQEWHNCPSNTDVVRMSKFNLTADSISVCVEEVSLKKIKPLTCKCCGAPITRETMTCEYCGTQYGR